MVEINFIDFKCNTLTVKHIILIAVLLLIASPLILSQQKSTDRNRKNAIELRNADIDNIDSKDVHHFLGNVDIKHGEIVMSCDSAYYSQKKNQVTAFSRVHIEQGDTIDLTGDYLFYDGKSEKAVVTGNVHLIDNYTHLYTDSLNYDVKNRIARYYNGGKIINGDNTLTSIKGIYYIKNDLFHYMDSVKIVNPEYVMTGDTLYYNTETEIAEFSGPSELNGDSLYLYCERGWYDTKNGITTIWKNALINNKKQIVRGDTLYYDDTRSYGESFGNVIIEDTTNNLIVSGNYAWYYKTPERFMVTDSAMFTQISKNDTMFLHADSLLAITVSDTSENGYKLMRAFYGCKIFSNDLQGMCDSLSYSFQDSVIRLYTFPVIWSEDNQLTADSMAIFTKNRQTDKLELYNSVFVTSIIDSIRYNQIKGRSLTGYFINNELNKIIIKGNGESIYYLLDGEEIAGINQSKCASIEAFVNNGKISEIYEYNNPEGFIDPPEETGPKELNLEGFEWLDNIRPKKKSDIFKKTMRSKTSLP